MPTEATQLREVIAAALRACDEQMEPWDDSQKDENPDQGALAAARIKGTIQGAADRIGVDLAPQERVVIEGAAERLDGIYRLADGLTVSVAVEGLDVVVRGADLHRFLARLDPDVWDATRARGDA